MASSNKPEPRAYDRRAQRVGKVLTRRAKSLAKLNVIVQKEGAARILTLPVNEGYKAPNRIDKERGVTYAEYDSAAGAFIPITPMPSPLEIAEMAMSYAAQEIAQPANLAKWAAASSAAAGGNRQLAEELVRLEPDPARSSTDVRNMLRKLEEWRQGKYKKATTRNRRRVAAYVLTHARHLSLGVTGKWYMLIEEGEELRGPIFRRFNTQADKRDDTDAARAALLAEGAQYIDTVEYFANRLVKAYAVYVHVVHGLHLELEP